MIGPVRFARQNRTCGTDQKGKGGMFDIAASTDFVGKLADGLDKFGNAIENSVKRGYRGYEFVSRERERRGFVDILHNFTRMRRTQGIFLGSLRYYLANPQKADWSYMAQTLQALTPIVDELLEKLISEDGEIVLQERQGFADLCAALQGRKEVLNWLADLKPPISNKEADSLKLLAEEYGRLIKSSERAALAIEAYARTLK
jgi:hypothetical protein